MTIKCYYDDLKTADDFMNSKLHHKLSSTLRYIISLIKDSEQNKKLEIHYSSFCQV